MYSASLKKFAVNLGLKPGKGAMYGVKDGLALVMCDNDAVTQLDIVFGDVPQDSSFTLEQLLPADLKPYKIKSISPLPIGNGISVVFAQSMGVLKRVDAFLQEEMKILADAGLNRGFVCPNCGQPVADEDVKITLFLETPAVVHAHCVNDFAAGLEREMNQAEQAAQESRTAGSEVRGFIGALLGALVCAIPWIIVYLIGYQTALLGVLIAFGAAFGHKLLGGKPGRGRVVSIIIATVLATVVAIFGSEVAEVGRMIVSGEMAELFGMPEGYFTLGVDLVPFMQMFYSDSGFHADMMSDRLSGAFMALIGLVAWMASNYRKARDKKNPRLKITTLG